MAVIRAQVVLEHTSGLPKNNAVNTFHFNGPTDAATLEVIRQNLIDFYTLEYAAGGGAVRSVGSFISTFFTNLRVKLYDVTGPPPHPPLLDQRTAFAPARNANVNLPAEVAVCLSFQGAPAGGLIQTRRRGRVYIGPLNTSAQVGAANAASRPASILLESLRQAAIDLASSVDANCEWVVYSRPFPGRAADEKRRANGTFLPALPARDGVTVNIDQVWVDDAFDTQRRRGEAPTTKGTISTTA